MKNLAKLLLKAKDLALLNPRITEMEIDMFLHNGKTEFTVLYCLKSGEQKRYFSKICPTKDKAIATARVLLDNYPLIENPKLLDWSVIPSEKWRERGNRCEGYDLNDDELLHWFCDIRQRAVAAWQDAYN